VTDPAKVESSRRALLANAERSCTVPFRAQRNL